MNENKCADEETLTWLYGLNWFDVNTSESRLAKYWASEEMAEDIRGVYLETETSRNYLIQLLKKEWFR